MRDSSRGIRAFTPKNIDILKLKKNRSTKKKKTKERVTTFYESLFLLSTSLRKPSNNDMTNTSILS